MALQELGQRIRLAREEKGMALEEVAQKIKLSVTILRAIEDGDHSALPHAVYTKGFTRSYATSVGLDLEEVRELLETAFAAEIAEDAQPEASLTPQYQKQNSSKSLAFYAIGLIILGLLGSGAWYVGTHYGATMLAAIKKPFTSTEQPPATEAPVLTIPQEEHDPALTIPQEEHDPALLPQTLEQSSDNTIPEPIIEHDPVVDVIPVIEAGDPQTQAAMVVSPTTSGRHEVEVTAIEECYLRIQREGAAPLHYTLKPGEQYKVRFDKRLNLLLGNAGGVTVTYNDKDMGVLGEKWQKRELVFPLPD